MNINVNIHRHTNIHAGESKTYWTGQVLVDGKFVLHDFNGGCEINGVIETEGQSQEFDSEQDAREWQQDEFADLLSVFADELAAEDGSCVVEMSETDSAQGVQYAHQM